MSYSLNEIKNIAQETAKVAKITIPKKGYDAIIAKPDKSGFVDWLKYAFEWDMISENTFEHFLYLFMEAHETVLLTENQAKANIFYSKISTLTAFGVDKALPKIKLMFAKITSA